MARLPRMCEDSSANRAVKQRARAQGSRHSGGHGREALREGVTGRTARVRPRSSRGRARLSVGHDRGARALKGAPVGARPARIDVAWAQETAGAVAVTRRPGTEPRDRRARSRRRTADSRDVRRARPRNAAEPGRAIGIAEAERSGTSRAARRHSRQTDTAQRRSASTGPARRMGSLPARCSRASERRARLRLRRAIEPRRADGREVIAGRADVALGERCARVRRHRRVGVAGHADGVLRAPGAECPARADLTDRHDRVAGAARGRPDLSARPARRPSLAGAALAL